MGKSSGSHVGLEGCKRGKYLMNVSGATVGHVGLPVCGFETDMAEFE